MSLTLTFVATRTTKRFTVYTEVDNKTGVPYPLEDMKKGLTNHKVGTLYLRSDGEMATALTVTIAPLAE